jgi:multiple sugar transport system permease protein
MVGLADPDLVTYGIIAAGPWPQIAYDMILYLTDLNNVSPDQVETVRLDWAKGWRMLYYVILPQLRPAIAALSVLNFTFLWNDFFWATVLTTSPEALSITADLSSRNGKWVAAWNLISAGSILAAQPPVAMFFLMQKHFIAGLTLGSIK